MVRREAGTQRVAPSRGRGERLLEHTWPLLLAVVLLLPLARPGHLLARDLVFVPHEPLTDASIGLGGTAPRSVPLDAVVAVATSVVDGAVVGRLLLLLTLVLAGWGVLRLTGRLRLGGRLAAAGFAVWNPFVVERLMLGQWALVLAYAVLPWLLVAAARHRRTGGRAALSSTLLWSALASLTPTGGLLAVAAVLAAGVSRARRTWLLPGLVVVLQLPWLVPAVVGGAGRVSDPLGVHVFAPGSDATGHPALALLGLGGVWDGLSVPGSRHTILAAATGVLVVAVLVLGLPRWWRSEPELAPALVVLAGAGLGLALLAATSAGQALLATLVAHVAGAGLLRDAQKLIAPFVLLVACALGQAVDGVTGSVQRHGPEAKASAALLLVALPLVLLPDAAPSVWRTVSPVDLPPGLARVVRVVDADPTGDGVVTLPWRSYRNFAWGTGLPSSDPVVRMVDHPVLTSDDLRVGRRVVPGESAPLASLGAALAAGRPAAGVLRRHDVGWVVVYPGQHGSGRVDLSGLRRVYGDRQLSLYAVSGAVGRSGVDAWRRVLVLAGDVLAVATVAGAAVAAGTSRIRGSRRGPGRC